MSDRHDDDEILGRALSRAIETQDVPETPYERSRLIVHPLRRGLPVWQMLGAAAVLVLAVAFGAWFTRPGDRLPAAASSTPVPMASATHSPAATAVPASATPRAEVDHAVVYFARDGLPPVAAPQQGLAAAFAGGHTSAEERIAARIGVLQGGTPPGGAINAFPGTRDNLIALRGGTTAVTIRGDVVTLDFNIPGDDWRVRGSATTLALEQQLVYTATEEPSVRRVLITQNGGKVARIDHLLWDKPLSREDVFGYTTIGPIGQVSDGGAPLSRSGSGPGGDQLQTTTGTSAKLTIQSGQNAAPAFAVYFASTAGSRDLEQLGKYVLTVVVGSSVAPNSWTAGAPQFVDQAPVRARIDANAPSFVVRQLFLDDARPWRAYRSGGDVVVEIGGDPRLVSDRIALLRPIFDEIVPGTITLSGVARTFEANVVWRVLDANKKVVTSGYTTASTGTSALWGTFNTQIPLPPSVRGRLTLEVYEVSPKDGSEQGLVAVPVNP